MKIALFLDVDMTLTSDYIQRVMARELDVEKGYLDIERSFQATGNSERFGADLVRLFAEKRFTRSRAEEIFEKVELRSYVKRVFELQKRGVDIYLVSSGPNYYIEVLARRMNVPLERTKCSEYRFENGIISRCVAVDRQEKIRFVLQHLQNYDLTIGIGDSEKEDAFVMLCTLAMLTNTTRPLGASSGANESRMNENFVHVAHFNAVFTLIDNLLTTRPERSPLAGLRNRPETPPSVPNWFPIAGVTFAAITAASLFYLLVAGAPIEAQKKNVFDVWVALCVSASATFLTGSAAASGKIPFLKDSPLQFSAIGGIGVFVVVLIILHNFA